MVTVGGKGRKEEIDVELSFPPVDFLLALDDDPRKLFGSTFTSTSPEKLVLPPTPGTTNPSPLFLLLSVSPLTPLLTPTSSRSSASSTPPLQHGLRRTSTRSRRRWSWWQENGNSRLLVSCWKI